MEGGREGGTERENNLEEVSLARHALGGLLQFSLLLSLALSLRMQEH
jgi:hypothetical protein